MSEKEANGFPWWHRDLRARVRRLEEELEEHNRLYAIVEEREKTRATGAARLWELAKMVVSAALGAGLAWFSK